MREKRVRADYFLRRCKAWISHLLHLLLLLQLLQLLLALELCKLRLGLGGGMLHLYLRHHGLSLNINARGAWDLAWKASLGRQ